MGSGSEFAPGPLGRIGNIAARYFEEAEIEGPAARHRIEFLGGEFFRGQVAHFALRSHCISPLIWPARSSNAGAATFSVTALVTPVNRYPIDIFVMAITI